MKIPSQLGPIALAGALALGCKTGSTEFPKPKDGAVRSAESTETSTQEKILVLDLTRHNASELLWCSLNKRGARKIDQVENNGNHQTGSRYFSGFKWNIDKTNSNDRTAAKENTTPLAPLKYTVEGFKVLNKEMGQREDPGFISSELKIGSFIDGEYTMFVDKDADGKIDEVCSEVSKSSSDMACNTPTQNAQNLYHNALPIVLNEQGCDLVQASPQPRFERGVRTREVTGEARGNVLKLLECALNEKINRRPIYRIRNGGRRLDLNLAEVNDLNLGRQHFITHAIDTTTLAEGGKEAEGERILRIETEIGEGILIQDLYVHNLTEGFMGNGSYLKVDHETINELDPIIFGSDNRVIAAIRERNCD